VSRNTKAAKCQRYASGANRRSSASAPLPAYKIRHLLRDKLLEERVRNISTDTFLDSLRVLETNQASPTSSHYVGLNASYNDSSL